MSNVIDIERLAEMPITDEFAKLMFSDIEFQTIDIEIKVCENYLEYQCEKNYCFQIHSDGSLCYIEKNCGYSCDELAYEILFAFQIVRYIDKYLNGGKSDVEKLVQDVHDSIHIGIVPVDDTDNVMFGTVKKLAEKYL